MGFPPANIIINIIAIIQSAANSISVLRFVSYNIDIANVWVCYPARHFALVPFASVFPKACDAEEILGCELTPVVALFSKCSAFWAA